MQRFVIEYTLPYTHRVQVGIEAESALDAEMKAAESFDNWTLWDDVPECVLLLDAYEENGDAGTTLQFTAVHQQPADTPWPAKDASVTSLQRQMAASKAASLLVGAYEILVDGSPQQATLELALQMAKAAVRT